MNVVEQTISDHRLSVVSHFVRGSSKAADGTACLLQACDKVYKSKEMEQIRRFFFSGNLLNGNKLLFKKTTFS